MATQLDQITQSLREILLDGEYEPGEALREVALAERLGVSRTLARLAMGSLEQEGLLNRAPNRGFRVRLFTIDEVADAIEVRGELEALAARTAAEKGISVALQERLRAILVEAEEIVETGLTALEARTRWIDLNVAFHAGIVEGAGNKSLGPAIEHICRIPLAAPRAIVFDRTQPDRNVAQVRAANADHIQILDAIVHRQGMRASCLIREHAFRSGRNKRTNFDALAQGRPVPELPGLALVRRAAED